MKIPKYVQKLIDRRCKLADQLATVCWELDEWLDKNEIECETCDTHTGVEIYCNPCRSKMRIMKAITDHPNRERKMKRMDEYNCGDCARFYSVDEWNGECSKHGCVSCMSKICKDFILNDMIKEDEGK